MNDYTESDTCSVISANCSEHVCKIRNYFHTYVKIIIEYREKELILISYFLITSQDKNIIKVDL